MGLNKTTISSFIEKIIPSVSNRGKVVMKDVSEKSESRFDPNKIIGNFYINTFQTSGSQKVLNKIVSTRNILGQIKEPEIKETFVKLYERIVNETTNIENLSDGITTLLQKVEMVENPEIKNEILSGIKEVTNFSKKGFKSSFQHEMQFVEDLTDTVNIMNGKYVNTESNPRELYKWFDCQNSWFTDVIDGKKGTPETYRNGYAQNKNRIKSYEDYVRDFDKFKTKNIPETYQNNLKLEAFRKFISIYSDTRKNIVDKIYDLEYLKTVNPELRKIYENIQKEYGTKVISSNANMSVKDAEFIQEELRLWKEAGSYKTLMPNIIDVNFLDNYIQQNNLSGVAFMTSKKIHVTELLEKEAAESGSTLRHELQHINDRYEQVPLDDFTRFYRFIQWRTKKLSQGKTWDKELENAGINNEFLRKYALEERGELKSVTAESNMQKLSDEFKDLLVNTFGMERWIFNLPQNKIKKAKILENSTAKNIKD